MPPFRRRDFEPTEAEMKRWKTAIEEDLVSDSAFQARFGMKHDVAINIAARHGITIVSNRRSKGATTDLKKMLPNIDPKVRKRVLSGGVELATRKPRKLK